MRLHTGLLLLALASSAGCVKSSAYQQEVKKADTATVQEQAAEKLNAQLEKEIKANQVEIQKLQDEVKVTVANQLLFSEGGWEIHRTGEETLDKMVPALKSLQGQRVDEVPHQRHHVARSAAR